MRRLASETMLAAQTVWERYEGFILVVLCFVFLLVCAAIGESRVR